MPATATTTRNNRTQLPPPPKLVKAEPRFLPPRIVLNAVEGWGKTSFAANAPKAAILEARGETGYETLLGGGRVPSIPAARIDNWDDLLRLLDGLIEECPHRVLSLDALGGFERLCHEKVCLRDFRGDWSEKGFQSFQQGYQTALADWNALLQRLDEIRDRHSVAMILLSHSAIKTHKNPTGPDFDAYVANVHHKTWSLTAKWADAVLFGKFITIVDDQQDNRAKGIGGTERILYTERRDAWDAKNRYGMPEEIEIPDDPASVWGLVINAMKNGEKGGK